MQRTLHFRMSLAVALAAVTLYVSAKETALPNPVWPPPPNPPRVVFVKTISGPADIGQSPSIWRRMANWVTGETGDSLKLQKPFGVALDEAGNLCITDTGANT